jgi:hypothetical protein
MSPREQFFAAVGRLTVAWALLESPIDAMVHIIHQRVGGHDIEREPPWGISKKLKFLRRCFRRIERLRPKTDEAIKLLLAIGPVADIRHDIIHGTVGPIPSKPQQQVRFSILTRGDAKPKVRVLVTTTEAIHAQGESLIAMSNDAATIAEWLIKEFVPS